MVNYCTAMKWILVLYCDVTEQQPQWFNVGMGVPDDVSHHDITSRKT